MAPEKKVDSSYDEQKEIRKWGLTGFIERLHASSPHEKMTRGVEGGLD